MGARAEVLASKLDQSCRKINAAVERLSDAEWKTVASAEQWSVGVVAHHHRQRGGNPVRLHRSFTVVAGAILLGFESRQAAASERALKTSDN